MFRQQLIMDTINNALRLEFTQTLFMKVDSKLCLINYYYFEIRISDSSFYSSVINKLSN